MKKIFLLTCMALLFTTLASGAQFLSVTGGFQSKVAGQSWSDWNPAQGPELTDPDSDNIYTATVVITTAGTYEWKITPSDSWDGNDLPSGSNQKFTTTSADESVTFYVKFGADLILRQGDETAICTHSFRTAVGDFQSEAGAPTDWYIDPAGPTIMYDDGTHGDATAGDWIWSYEATIAAGNYEWKPALNSNWDMPQGAANRPFKSDGVTPIKFLYDFNTNTYYETGDVESPEIMNAWHAYGARWILVEFQVAVEEASAENTTNWALSGGLNVVSATRSDANNALVAIEASGDLTPGTSYDVSATSLKSRDSGETMTGVSTKSFTARTQVTFTFDNNLDKHNFDILEIKGQWDGWTALTMLYDDGSTTDVETHIPGVQGSEDATAGDDIWTRVLLIEPGDYSSDGYAYRGWNYSEFKAFEFPELFVENFGRASTDGALVVGTSPLTRNNTDMVDNWVNEYPAVYVTFIVNVSGAFSVAPDWVGVQGEPAPLDWNFGSHHMVNIGPDLWSVTLVFPVGSKSPIQYKYTASLPVLGDQWEPGFFHNRAASLWPLAFTLNDTWGTWSAYLQSEPPSPEPQLSVNTPWALYE
ncbi:MAG TPA: hypothetical protein PLB62_10680 [Candidatus Sumerlaeota bacterium]|nr:hypothetical protein [Candidatus Sumerlaeota bacterium]